MIHQVPIKSLPQDWLWCETWCSDKSKATAKTIDMVIICFCFCCLTPSNYDQYMQIYEHLISSYIEYSVTIL